uniref:peroxiredoxin-5, mitochondrial-like n=2 Tax=Myxine glutinosa TaxID=7769 RepID=UPI00358F3B7B
MASNAVAVKLPEFWEAQAEVWFVQAEAQFQLRGITADETRYYHVIAALGPGTAARVVSILRHPPAEHKHKALKRFLIATFGLTDLMKHNYHMYAIITAASAPFRGGMVKHTCQVGMWLPYSDLHEGSPDQHVNVAELFAGKKGVLFGVPGAFTPGCQMAHLPGYVQNFYQFQAKGVDVIACVSVNDAYVMSAWGLAHRAEGKVRMLADPTGAFTQAIGLLMDYPDVIAKLGNRRSKRYSMLVENGLVTKIFVEPDGGGLTCSLAQNILSVI